MTLRPDTAWIRHRVLRDYGSLADFAACMRRRGHRVMTAETLAAVLDGVEDLWSDEAVEVAQMIGATIGDVLASLCLARIDRRFALAVPQDDLAEAV